MKTIVIYKSKSGFTKTYAELIAEALQCDLKENKDLSVKDIAGYDTIICGGGLYAVRINGVDFIKKNWNEIKDKNLIVWATGSSPGREEELQALWKNNFSEEQIRKLKLFYLRGGFDYKKLNAADKLVMSMLKIKLKATKDRTEDEEGMLQAYDIPEYHMSKENIEPLINYVNNLK